MSFKYTKRYMREHCTYCCMDCPYNYSHKIYELNQKLEVMEAKARIYKAALEEISEYVTGDVEFDDIRLILEGVFEEEQIMIEITIDENKKILFRKSEVKSIIQNGNKVTIDVGGGKNIIIEGSGVYNFVKEQLKNKYLTSINNQNTACKFSELEKR